MIEPNMIGAYGSWAAALPGDGPARLSLRRGGWPSLGTWRETARERLHELLAAPELGDTPTVTMERCATYDGLHVEELSWQLPYGPPTRAVLVKPEGATGPLPAILALHDHGGNKFFGCDKITQTDNSPHPLMVDHQEQYYSGRAWANEMAHRGYAVLVPDAFLFASRRVRLADVPAAIREGLVDDDSTGAESVHAYNRWAAGHESVMAKSLFCAGTTWPGMFLAEDRVALDILCARDDVDARRVGCGGLSGGGMRTVFLAGTDDRIRCAVCVGLMSTWRDCLLYKSHTHTWMLYVPLLPRDLDFPEILGLRAPLPTLVLNNSDDALFTLPEMRRADGMLAEVFLRAGAPERYRCSYYPGPHKFDLPMQEEAFDWFDRWLTAP
jgi:dienelactone hydrolase